MLRKFMVSLMVVVLLLPVLFGTGCSNDKSADGGAPRVQDKVPGDGPKRIPVPNPAGGGTTTQGAKPSPG